MSSTISNTLEEEWEWADKKKVVKFVQIFIAVLQTYITDLKI